LNDYTRFSSPHVTQNSLKSFYLNTENR